MRLHKGNEREINRILKRMKKEIANGCSIERGFTSYFITIPTRMLDASFLPVVSDIMGGNFSIGVNKMVSEDTLIIRTTLQVHR